MLKVAIPLLALVGIAVALSLVNGSVGFAGEDSTPTENGSASAQETSYRSGEPFVLEGIEQGQGESADIREQVNWLGSMEITVHDPVLFENAQAAGASSDGWIEEEEGLGVVAVSVELRNIDATLRPAAEGDILVPAILLTMFDLQVDDDDCLCSVFDIDAPEVSGLDMDPSKAKAYTWVEAGQTAHVSLYYYVERNEKIAESADGGVYQQVDSSREQHSYTMKITMGDERSALLVGMGALTEAA